MTAWRRRTAFSLLRWSARIAPRERMPWIHAMMAEMAMIEDDRAVFDFALGCLSAATKERLCRRAVIAHTLRVATPVALSVMALLGIFLAGRNAASAAPVAAVFALTATLFAVGAALHVMRGARSLARYAGMLIPLYLILFASLRLLGDRMADAATASLYRALALEGIAIWTALLLAALFVADTSRQGRRR